MQKFYAAGSLVMLLTITGSTLPGAQKVILTYQDAVKIALTRSPDLKATSAEIARAHAERADSDHILPSNPDLDATYLTGTKGKSPAVIYSPAAALSGSQPLDVPSNAITGPNSQRTHGFEIGITQELDVWGKQKARRNIADISMLQAQATEELTRLQTRAQVRENLMTVAALDEMLDGVHATVTRLRNLRAALGDGFVDPRLGAYASTAFRSDLAGLEADERDLKENSDRSRFALHRILGLTNDDFAAPAPDGIPLPEPPDVDEAIRRAKLKNPERKNLDLQLRKSELNKKSSDLAGLPNPSLFFGVGQNTLGTGNMGLKGPGLENERETTFRFGAKISLPIMDQSKAQVELAAADEAKARAELDRLDSQLELVVRQTHSRYLSLRVALRDLGSVWEARGHLAAIDQAFLAGRISYFDFANEYERLNKMMKRRADTYVSAAQACGALEMLTGQTFDKDF